MKQLTNFLLLSAIVPCGLVELSPTIAQVVPDATLPVNSQVIPCDDTNVITGGTQTNRAVGIAVLPQKEEERLFVRTRQNTVTLPKVLAQFSSNHAKTRIETYSQNLNYAQQYLNKSLSNLTPKQAIQPSSNQQFPIRATKIINLRSKRGVNYTRLRDLLAQGNWQEADEETWQVLRQAEEPRIRSGRIISHDVLVQDSIVTLPCEDLRTIEQLWMKYSNRRFGFSAQKRIWENVGGTPKAMSPVDDSRDVSKEELVVKRFAKRVGWDNAWYRQINGSWNLNVTYNLSAPVGHLPFMQGRGIASVGMWSWISAFAQRLETCKYQTF